MLSSRDFAPGRKHSSHKIVENDGFVSSFYLSAIVYPPPVSYYGYTDKLIHSRISKDIMSQTQERL